MYNLKKEEIIEHEIPNVILDIATRDSAMENLNYLFEDYEPLYIFKLMDNSNVLHAPSNLKDLQQSLELSSKYSQDISDKLRFIFLSSETLHFVLENVNTETLLDADYDLIRDVVYSYVHDSIVSHSLGPNTFLDGLNQRLSSLNSSSNEILKNKFSGFTFESLTDDSFFFVNLFDFFKSEEYSTATDSYSKLNNIFSQFSSGFQVKESKEFNTLKKHFILSLIISDDPNNVIRSFNVFSSIDRNKIEFSPSMSLFLLSNFSKKFDSQFNDYYGSLKQDMSKFKRFFVSLGDFKVIDFAIPDALSEPYNNKIRKGLLYSLYISSFGARSFDTLGVNNLTLLKKGLTESDLELLKEALSENRKVTNLGNDFFTFLKKDKKIKTIFSDYLSKNNQELIEAYLSMYDPFMNEFNNFLNGFVEHGLFSEEILNDLKNVFIGNPLEFNRFYSIYLEQRVGNDFFNSDRLDSFAHMHNMFYGSSEEDLDTSRKTVLLYRSLSTYMSRSIKQMDLNFDNYQQLKDYLVENNLVYLNDLMDVVQNNFSKVFLTPLVYSVLPKQDLLSKKYLRAEDYDNLISHITKFWGSQGAKDTQDIIPLLQSLRDNFIDAKGKENSKIASLSILFNTETPDTLKIGTFSSFKVSDYDSDWVNGASNLFLQNMYSFQSGLILDMSKNLMSEEVTKYLSMFSDLSQVMSHFENHVGDVLDSNLSDEEKGMALTETQRAFLASVAFYGSKFDLFDPGRYVRSRHDCFDFASSIVVMSDLNINVHSFDDFQNFYNYLTHNGLKYDTKIISTLYINTLQNMTWANPKKKIVFYMFANFVNYDLRSNSISFAQSSDPYFNKYIEQLKNDFVGLPKIERYLLSDSKSYYYLSKQLLNSHDAGNFLVVQYQNRSELNFSDKSYRLSSYVSKGEPSEELLGKWIFFDNSSPWTNVNDHQAIFSYDRSGDFVAIDFSSSHKVGFLSWKNKIQPIHKVWGWKNKEGKYSYVGLRLSRPVIDHGDNVKGVPLYPTDLDLTLR